MNCKNESSRYNLLDSFDRLECTATGEWRQTRFQTLSFSNLGGAHRSRCGRRRQWRHRWGHRSQNISGSFLLYRRNDVQILFEVFASDAFATFGARNFSFVAFAVILKTTWDNSKWLLNAPDKKTNKLHGRFLLTLSLAPKKPLSFLLNVGKTFKNNVLPSFCKISLYWFDFNK